MDLEFTVNKPDLWLKSIAHLLNTEIRDNTIYLPKDIGEGFIKQFHFKEEFTLNYMHFRLIKPINFIRNPGKEMSISPIFFYINNSIYDQFIKEDIVKVGLKSANGIFWPSSQIETTWPLPLNEWVSNITISVYHIWLINCLDDERENHVIQLINQKQPYYIFEEITAEMLPIIKAIESTLQKNHTNGILNLVLKSKATELLALFFEKLITRPLSEKNVKFHPSDIKKIFEVKNILYDNLSNDVSIKQIASDFGMSDSKIQKLFKHIFGKSIYQYILSIRMEHAKNLLQSGNYSVSEVGFQVGYSNLSHFSKMFYKHYGIKPGKFLTSQYSNGH